MDLLLLSTLKDLTADLSNPELFYMIMAGWHEIDDERRHFVPVYLNCLILI